MSSKGLYVQEVFCDARGVVQLVLTACILAYVSICSQRETPFLLDAEGIADPAPTSASGREAVTTMEEETTEAQAATDQKRGNRHPFG